MDTSAAPLTPPVPVEIPAPARRGDERSAFELYRDGLTHDWVKMTALLGVGLIPMFLVLDYFTMPAELLRRFAVYRAVGTGFAAALYLLARISRPSRFSFLFGYFFSLVIGGMIALMTVDLGGFDSAYYAGLNLVVVAVNLLLPWRAIHSALNGLLVAGMYVALNVLWGDAFHGKILINNLYFLLSTVVICVAITFLKHRLVQTEFQLRQELVAANESLDKSRQELKAARDALWGEMEVAKRIQTALLPKNQRLGRYEVAAVMCPAEVVGGDYYDLIATRAGEHWLAIGDVSGHGVESGLVMMMTQTSIFTMVNDAKGRTPSEVFASVNGVIRENIARLDTTRYMTLNVVRLHPDRLTVAGKHQDILIHRRKTGRIDQISNEGSWVGILADTRGAVEDLDIPLEDGDTVLLFTDGVTEASSPGGEMYGQDRLVESFKRIAAMPLEQGLAGLMTDIGLFQEHQQDDITMLLLRAS